MPGANRLRELRGGAIGQRLGSAHRRRRTVGFMRNGRGWWGCIRCWAVPRIAANTRTRARAPARGAHGVDAGTSRSKSGLFADSGSGCILQCAHNLGAGTPILHYFTCHRPPHLEQGDDVMHHLLNGQLRGAAFVWCVALTLLAPALRARRSFSTTD